MVCGNKPQYDYLCNMENKHIQTSDNLKKLFYQAEAIARQGEKALAVALLTQYISKAPEECLEEAYRLRGQLLLQLGDKQAAERDAIEVLKLHPAIANGKYQAEGKE